MNAIRNYLDNMFRNLPNIEEVRRAKSELLQMMEDKYEELISEGKTENEAVGIVISEFGNLDEVAESIGISQILKDNREPDKPILSMERVKEFLLAVSARSNLIAAGVGLCIMSVMTWPMASLISSGNDAVTGGLGTAGFFAFIAAAVVFFIVSASKNSDFKEINKDTVSLGIETSDYVRNERRRFKPTYSTMVAIGIALCIFSVAVPVVIASIPFVDDTLCAVMFFFTIAVGVFLIVTSNIRMSGYERLMQLNGAGKMSEEFIPKEDRKVSKAPIIISIIVVVVVLGIGAVTGLVRFFGFIGTGNGNSIKENYDIDASGIDSIDVIRVDADFCSVVITTDDSVDGIEASYKGDEDLMPQVEYRNGELVITQNAGVRNNAVWNDGPEVVVTVSDDIALNDIEVSIDAGNLEVSNAVFSAITGEFSAGNVEVNNSTCDSMEISADAGNYEIRDCESGSVRLTTDAGNIEMRNTGFETLFVRSDFGNIDVDGIRDIDSYSISAECDVGSVEIDGRDEGSSYHSNGTGSGSITVECDAGSIDIG